MMELSGLRVQHHQRTMSPSSQNQSLLSRMPQQPAPPQPQPPKLLSFPPLNRRPSGPPVITTTTLASSRSEYEVTRPPPAAVVLPTSPLPPTSLRGADPLDLSSAFPAHFPAAARLSPTPQPAPEGEGQRANPTGGVSRQQLINR